MVEIVQKCLNNTCIFLVGLWLVSDEVATATFFRRFVAWGTSPFPNIFIHTCIHHTLTKELRWFTNILLPCIGRRVLLRLRTPVPTQQTVRSGVFSSELVPFFVMHSHVCDEIVGALQGLFQPRQQMDGCHRNCGGKLWSTELPPQPKMCKI